MKSWYLALAALTGFLSVALGAAGDHLAGMIRNQHAFETALRYNQLYSILLVMLALYAPPPARLLDFARAAFMAGTLTFCGSLYALAFTGLAALGMLTPLGGLTLMAGWLLLAAYGIKRA
jgi:uncharacterized membrane protein YgdD (TMEM256/DUF423 family)